MNKLMYFWLVLLLLLCSGGMFAQSNPFRSEHLSTVDGLSNNFISAICQDREGFMWFGTADGLNKFDGYQFTAFQFDPAAGNKTLQHTIITDVHEDRKGRIWVVTMGGGLHQVDKRTGHVTAYNQHPALSYYWNVHFNLFEDRQGILWLGTPLGLLRFEPETKNFTQYPMERVNHIIGQDTRGDLIVEVKSRGQLFRFDPRTGLFTPIRINLPKLTHNPNIWRRAASGRQFALPYQADKPVSPYAFLLDKSGELWIGTEGNGLFRVKIAGDMLTPIAYNPKGLVYQTIYESGIFEDSAGFVWISSPKGLQQINTKTNELITYQSDPTQPGSLSSNDVRAIFRDRTGTVWIGTDNGINQLGAKPKAFRTYPTHLPPSPVRLPEYNFQAVLQDHTGTTWLGSLQKGLYRVETATGKLQHIRANSKDPLSLSSEGVSTLFEDHADQVWVSTKEALHQLDRESGTFKRYTTQVPVMCMDEDRDGNLWIGGSVGLKGAIGRLNPITGQIYYYTRDVLQPKSEAAMTSNRTLSHFLILDIMVSRTGNIWIATAQGLNKLDPATGNFTYYQANQAQSSGTLTDNWVRALHEDKEGILWVGTNHGGLNRFDPVTNKFSHYTINNGLPSNQVVSIAPDNLGSLWLGTGHGISQFNPSTRQFRNFDVRDGLPDNECNLGSVHSRQGKLLFGTINGAVDFEAAQILKNTVIPPIHLTGLTVQEKRQPIPAGALELPHNQNFVSFEFVSLNYDAPEKNQYAFQLVGLDKEWIFTGNHRFARYTDLRPGSYTFRVKGSNNDGIWNQTGTSLRVIVHPPWWKTGWAYALYAALMLALIWLARQQLIKRERLRTQLRFERLAAEKLQEIDTLKSDFFTNLSHEFRTPLALIKGTISKLQSAPVTAHDADYQLIDRQSDQLLDMINQLLDLSKLEAGKLTLNHQATDLNSFLKELAGSFIALFESRGIIYRFTFPMQPVRVQADQDKLTRILSNLLSNAAKFTPAGGQVQFSAIAADIQYNTLSLRITIQDTGIGIPSHQLPHIFDRFFQADRSMTRSYGGTGIGLALVKELVEFLGGTISVESAEGEGATFTLGLPFSIINQEQETGKTVPFTFTHSSISLIQEAKSESAGGKAQLLIIEDNADLRNFLVDCFSPAYQTLAADNGNDGFNCAVKHLPDLIISDIMMPGTNGVELCRRLKTDERTSHIPVVLLTAKTGTQSKLAGLETGADEYLTKPFVRQELVIRVKNLLDGRRKLRERFSKQLVLHPSELTVTSIDEKFLQSVFALLEKNLSNAEFDLNSFCQEMGMSQTHLHRKLTALLGQSANELIRSFRLKRAASLLSQKHGNVSEIAFMVGFTSPNYFTKCFREEFGQTPTEYVRLHALAK
ncbi:hybrid sensor histidine kinase/response regulator transcription factor [Dyadobacter fanqingshengii]|uniref:histidine kinase n=1 Tax=Dyadobacter fanqingshengii TaxID=2906443 RepID=A0A9X1PA38_9BACT|nr:two-component regulator propeller domain-containing protein [Dyadobacter fanqingshengii]MCF0041491.1 ATP-binding protein [Dyadobacter fanqingshengii]USJ36790.1 ATP-binding protein [Dyadobacter fanqingshengii]